MGYAVETMASRTYTRRQAIAGAAAAGACAATVVAGRRAGADEAASDVRVVTGSGTGRMGKIMVKVALAGTTIVGIDVVKQRETDLIAAAALSRIPQLVVKNQSLDIDAVAGATVTSMGVMLAIRDALEQAEVDEGDLAQVDSDDGIHVEEPIADADAFVVGGGLAGLACAVRMLQRGKRIVMFEETAHLGGSAVAAAGWISGGGSQMQAVNGIEDSPEQYYRYMEDLAAKYGGVIDSPEPTRSYAYTSAEALDWLDSYVRVDFGDRQATPGVYDAPDVNRTYRGNAGGYAIVYPLIGLLQEGVAAGNASVVLEARVTRLLTDDAGAIVGVEVTYGNGEVREYACPNVVLASGGYGSNMEYLKKYNYTNCGSSNPSTSMAHGFEIAQEAGAQLAYMELSETYGGGIKDAGDEIRHQANLFLPGQVWVTPSGERLTNEDDWLHAHDMWVGTPDNIGYVIMSDVQLAGNGRPIVTTSFHEGEISPFDSWDIFDGLEGELTFKADSAAELAKRAGIDPAGLEQTVANWNSYCDAGVDEEFGNESLQKLEGTLYAIKCVPYELMTTGGVKVDGDFRVLDADSKPIAGLYAAGEQVGLHQYAAYTRAGCGLGGAVTLGYYVGTELSV